MEKQKIAIFLVLFSLITLPFICHASVESAITSATNWLIGVAAVVCVLMIVIGGFMMILSAGDPGKVSTGRMMIMWAVIGLVICGVAASLVNIVQGWAGGA